MTNNYVEGLLNIEHKLSPIYSLNICMEANADRTIPKATQVTGRLRTPCITTSYPLATALVSLPETAGVVHACRRPGLAPISQFLTLLP